MLRFPALYRFLGLVAIAVPVSVIACTTEVTPPIGDGTPAPSPSSSSTETDPTDPPPAPTGTSTTTPPPKDAGPPPKDAGPPPTDVIGSAECTAYCAKMKNTCNKTCDPKYDCAIAKGQCAASTRDYLDCKTTQGTWYCGGDGFSIVSSCTRDLSLCN